MCDWDPRIIYLFTKISPTMLDRQFNFDKPGVIMAWMFEHLWGDRAPLEFQSYVTVGHTIHELTRDDPDDDGTPTYIKEHTKKRALAKEVTAWLSTFLSQLCNGYAMEQYRPDLYEGRAAWIRKKLDQTCYDVSFLDVIERTDLYEKKRKKIEHFNPTFKIDVDNAIELVFMHLENTKAGTP